MQAVLARLENLLDPRFSGGASRYEGFQAGGGGVVEKAQVVLRDVEVGARDGDISVRFLRDGASLEATVAALGLPTDWAAFSHLDVTFVGGDVDLMLHVTVVGARGRLIQTARVPAGQKARLSVDLGDLPLGQANHPSYQPVAVRLTAQWGDSWPTEGARIVAGQGWPATANNAPADGRIREVALLPHASSPRRAVCDRFGQRIRGDWPGKVRFEDELRRRAEEERRSFAASPAPKGRSVYGGWTDGPRLEASGFFRVHRDADGRWWYVDPDGWPFWSLGTTGVRIADTTIVEGREFLFEELPAVDGPYAKVLNPPINSPANDPAGRRTVAFYYWNVLRKWGTEEAWRDHVAHRFRAWGLNTVANWSQESVLRQRIVPHVRTLTTRVEGAPRVAQRMPDVWSSRWLAAFEAHVAHDAAPHRDNPWLLGYFCDNEMPWGGLHKRILDCPSEAAARDAFVDFLRRRYGSLDALRRDFGSAVTDWSTARGLIPEQLPAEGPSQETMLDFAGEYAERYFRLVSETIRRHDPNHLYLGCRFVRGKPDDRICAAAGRHSPVVTVNCYDLWPRREQFGDWHRACGGRPIQIGEFHLPLSGNRQLPPLYPAFTADERRQLVMESVRKWAEQPYAVGAHWYQHADQHITGRPADGENQPCGLVDITDTPHPDIVGALGEAALGMYAWHARSA
jgi:hypothetical protein